MKGILSQMLAASTHIRHLMCSADYADQQAATESHQHWQVISRCMPARDSLPAIMRSRDSRSGKAFSVCAKGESDLFCL